MDVLAHLGGGFLQVLYPPYLLLAIAGVAVGMIAGVLPGITGIMVLILMLPLTYKMAAIPALILLTSAYVGGAFGGTITAILFNIPGDPDSVPSLWDGYPMARAGKAGKALGIAAFSAVFGGLAGTIVLTFLSEPFARVALEFSSAEFFSIVVFGLASVTALGAGSLRLALISLVIGLLIGTVGLDDIYGQERFTFGSSISARRHRLPDRHDGRLCHGRGARAAVARLSHGQYQRTRRHRRAAAGVARAAAAVADAHARDRDRHGDRRDPGGRRDGRRLRVLRRGKAVLPAAQAFGHRHSGRTRGAQCRRQCHGRRRLRAAA